MGDYTTIKAWQRGDALAKAVYLLIRSLPARDRAELGDQLRRAALSIPVNIAEGSGRGSDKDMARFLRIALGSASETHYLLGFMRDLRIVRAPVADPLIDEALHIRRMLAAFARNLRRNAED